MWSLIFVVYLTVIVGSIQGEAPVGAKYTWLNGYGLPSDGVRNASYVSSPGGRSGAVLAVDDVDGVYLYGGTSTLYGSQIWTVQSDLWLFTGSSSNAWTWIAGLSDGYDPPNYPGRRVGAVFGNINGNIGLFGGQYVNADGTFTSEYLGDFWVFNKEQKKWFRVDNSGPALSNAGYAIDSYSKALYIAVGKDAQDKFQRAIWKFNGLSWTVLFNQTVDGANYPSYPNSSVGTDGKPIQPQLHYFMATWATMDTVYVYGGDAETEIPELWYFTSEWHNAFNGTLEPTYPDYPYDLGDTCDGCNPGVRFNARTWVLGGELWLAGGQPRSDKLYNDTWKYSIGVGWYWMGGTKDLLDLIYTPVYPVTSCNTTMCATYGGRDENNNILTGLQLTGSAQLTLPPTVNEAPVYPDALSSNIASVHPPSLEKAGIAYLGTTVFLFGGASGVTGEASNEVWRFSGTWELYEPLINAKPPPRMFPVTFVYNTRLYIFGGETVISGELHYLADMWYFDLTLMRWYNVYTFDPDVNGDGSYPGARTQMQHYFDGDSLWLFGGFGYDDISATPGYLNDLWQYSMAGGGWLFKKGSTTCNQTSTDVPGGRAGALSSGNRDKMFVYGGVCFGEATVSASSEFWSYSFIGDEWVLVSNLSRASNYPPERSTNPSASPGTRVNGNMVMNSAGPVIFGGEVGTPEVPKLGNDLWLYLLEASGDNLPGWYFLAGDSSHGTVLSPPPGEIVVPPPAGRKFSSMVAFQETAWIFGGRGYDHNELIVSFADMWKVSLLPVFTTENRAWYKSHNGRAMPTIEAISTPSPIDPGIRSSSASCVYGNRLWLFGGYSFDVLLSSLEFAMPVGGIQMSDFWSYDLVTRTWTWQGGFMKAPPAYAAINTTNENASPGARSNAKMWGYMGNIWLFGGYSREFDGVFSDLWRFDITLRQWFWMAGDAYVNALSYSTVYPDALYGVSFTVFSDSVYFYGGTDSSFAQRNDIWQLHMPTLSWTHHTNEPTLYPVFPPGVKQYMPGNTPGARTHATIWVVASMLWLFGGVTHDQYGNTTMLSDLWAYDLVNGRWLWEAGSSTEGSPLYPALGYSCDDCRPGARSPAGASWQYGGNLYLYGGSNTTDITVNGAMYDDIWIFSLADLHWYWLDGQKGPFESTPNNTRPTVVGAAVGYSNDDKIWFYGGHDYWNVMQFGMYSYAIVGNSWQNYPITPTPGPQVIYPNKVGDNSISAHPASGYDCRISPASSGSFKMFSGFTPFFENTSLAGISITYPAADIWQYGAGEWEFLGSAEDPQPILRGSSILFTQTHMYSFGGYSANGFTNEVWKCTLSGTGCALLGGGVGVPGTYTGNNLWPAPRISAASWTVGEDLWVFGGDNGPLQTLGDLWIFQSATDTWRLLYGNDTLNVPDSTSGIGSRISAGGTGNGTFVWIHGGAVAVPYGLLATLWQFSVSSSQWTILYNEPDLLYPADQGIGGGTFGPGTRGGHTIHYSNNSIVLFGGSSTVAAQGLEDVWSFDLTRNVWFWVGGSSNIIQYKIEDSLSPPSPLPRQGHCVSYDNTRGGFWLYGGLNSEGGTPGLLADLWLITVAPFPPIEPTTTTTSGIPGADITTTTTGGIAATTGSISADSTTTTSAGAVDTTTTTAAAVDSTSTSNVAVTTTTTATAETTASTASAATTQTSVSSTTSTTSPSAVCGNGKREGNEECDSIPQSPCCSANCTFLPATVVCRESRGVCDSEDHCSGKSASCPDKLQSPGFVCKNATVPCEIATICGNSTANCPDPLVLTPDPCGVCGGDNTSCYSTGGACGDNHCNSLIGENCTTCSLDCNSCPPVVCPNNCNGRGSCNNGLCMCYGNWTGNSCENDPVPIVVDPVGTNVTVTPGKNNQTSIKFTVALNEIKEINNTADVVKYDLSLQNLSVTSIDTLPDGSTRWQYQLSLPNKAVVLIHFIKNGATSLSVGFGNTTIVLAPNSVKFSFEIVNWPFQTVRNRLVLSMGIGQSGATSSCQVESNFSQDDSNNVRWTQLLVDDLIFYGRFLDYALVDDVIKTMQVSTANTGSILAFTLPHFWLHAVIDPDFSVLVNPNPKDEKECSIVDDGKSSNKPAIIGGVTAAVVFVALASAVALYAVKKRQANKRFKKLQAASNNSVSLKTVSSSGTDSGSNTV